jgi:hypothetical protein
VILHNLVNLLKSTNISSHLLLSALPGTFLLPGENVSCALAKDENSEFMWAAGTLVHRQKVGGPEILVRPTLVTKGLTRVIDYRLPEPWGSPEGKHPHLSGFSVHRI